MGGGEVCETSKEHVQKHSRKTFSTYHTACKGRDQPEDFTTQVCRHEASLTYNTSLLPPPITRIIIISVVVNKDEL
jgi:hypothetical protein